MKLLLTSISAAALLAAPVLAQGNGNGNRGNDRAAQQDNRGNGNANRGNRGGGQEARGNRGGGNGNANRGNRGGPPEVRGNGNRGGPPQARGNDRGGPPVARGNGNRGNDNAFRGNGNGNRGGGNDRIGIRYDDGPVLDFRRDTRRIADGCPPGLARKYNGCRPPGLARQQDRDSYRRYAPDWWGYGDAFGDRRGSYFYDDGFLLRLGDGGRISGFIPLLGGALSIGNAWPDDYRYARVPAYYESYYGLGPADRYRYADDVIYRMDPETAAITGIAALLTGNDFTVGQRMPRGYDVYNVPYSYRDRYYDRPDAMYRYNNGYVYEIDPETMLVASAIELLM
ncbi:hypothetical protein [Aurantiacibacter gangjinensis]|uniref:hypothetical protein n=1 Tax=Aurantiacibacter gangjinensis TaxID=502682 RepID=UPI00069982FC|nr:hypothetical protein [Aurantiacibacter gangjinensis]APE27042.1 PE_PGRS family protein [Aurantiacibacter gangjinensis]